MNPSVHKIIIQAILDVSKERFPETNFKKSLGLIIHEFQDQITIDENRHPDASPSRVGRRPESPVVDSWRIWSGGPPDTDRGCWWVNCTFSLTVDFIENIFRGPSARVATGVSYLDTRNNVGRLTWGTLLRYLVFINKDSEEWIPLKMEGEYGWGDHLSCVSNFFLEMVEDVGHPRFDFLSRVPEYWTQTFNDKEAEYMETISRDRARELGYLVPESPEEPMPEPEPEPEPEPDPVQQSNESVRVLQDMIDSIARGEKPELNEGEYLQLSQSLKGFFQSSE
jgi:hypothetical protein